MASAESADAACLSPSQRRTPTTPNNAAPMVDAIDDWMLLSEPPAEN